MKSGWVGGVYARVYVSVCLSLCVCTPRVGEDGSEDEGNAIATVRESISVSFVRECECQ